MNGAVIASGLAFGVGFLGSVPVAGPIAVLILARATEAKYRDALLIALGGGLAEGPYAGLAFFGFTTFLARYTWILPASHAVAGLLLLGLGIHFARWHSSRKGAQTSSRRGSGVLIGFSIAALNPTLIVTWSAVTAVLFSHFPSRFENWMAVPFGISAGLGILSWNALLILLLKQFRDRFPHGLLTWGVRAVGVVLCALSAISFFKFLDYLIHGHRL